MRARRVVLTTVAVIAAAAIVAWLRRDPDKLLDPISTRLFPWPDKQGGRNVYRYAWLSDREMLQVDAPSMITYPRGFARFDLTHRTSTDMPVFHRAVHRAGKDAWPMVSPDGKWAIGWAVDLGPTRKEWIWAIRLQDSKVIQWPPVEGGIRDYHAHGWSSDSTRYEIVFGDRVVYYPLDRPGVTERVPLPRFSGNMGFIGMLPDGLLYAEGRQLDAGRPLTLVRYQFARDKFVASATPLKLPARATVACARLSPDGKQLAWQLVLHEPAASGWRKLLNDLLGRRSHKRQGIWISHVDGTGLREVGHVHDDDLSLNSWVPGGRRVAFIRHDHLFTVPVQ